MLLSITAISSQPFVWSVFLERTNTNPKHASLFAFSRSAALALWGAYLASLLAGEGWDFNTATPEFARVKQVGSPPHSLSAAVAWCLPLLMR